MPFDMTRPVTPVAGPNYQQNKAQLQQMGFQAPRYGAAPQQAPAPRPTGTNAGVEELRRQGFQVQMPQSPAVPPAPRPVSQGASTRPAGYAAAVGNVNQRTQDQLARNRAMQAQMGMDASWNRAANAPSSPQARYEKQMEEWRAKNAAAIAQRQAEGRGQPDYTAPGFPDPQPSATSSKPFDRYYGHGDKETWQAHGSPKGGRPGQARPSPQPGQGTPYGTDATGQTAINDERWGRGRWAYGRTQPNAPAAPNAQPGGDALQTIAQQAPPSMYQMPGRTFGPGADPLQQAYQQSMNAWQMPKQQLMQWGQQQQNVPWGPNYGNNFANRPDPYSLNVQGQFGNNLQDMWGGIGGFIQGVNDQAAQQRVGTYLGQGNPGAGYGKVNYNVPQLVQQGNQMVANGWQNPFM